MIRVWIILFFCITYGYGQQKNALGILNLGREWMKGSVQLTNGTELTGMVHYNNKTGIVSFANDTIFKSISSRHLYSFHYFDPRQRRQRYFYSMQMPDQTGLPPSGIFEVMKLCKSFAVLAYVPPLEYEKPENVPTRATQRETIWFLPAGGEPTLYLAFQNLDDIGVTLNLNRDKVKTLNTDIFARCTGSFFPVIEAYAQQNNLAFWRKDDVLAMLNYYERITR